MTQPLNQAGDALVAVGIYPVTISLTAAEMASLATTSIQVGPTPGSGQILSVVSGAFQYQETAVAFGSGLAFLLGQNLSFPAWGSADLSGDAGSDVEFSIVQSNGNNGPTPNPVGLPLLMNIVNGSGDPQKVWGAITSSTLHTGGTQYVVNDTGVVDQSAASDDATYVINSVSHGGAEYAVNDTGTISQVGGAGATYTVNSVSGSGAVLTFTRTANGTGYTTANNVATAQGGGQPGAGSGFCVDITAAGGVISASTLSATGGSVLTYTLTHAGTSYATGLATTATGGAQPGVGSDFTLNLVVSTAGTGPAQVDLLIQVVDALT